MPRVTVQAVGRGVRRCALCHDDLPLSAARTCPDCGAATHGDCRVEAGGCPSLGCAQALRPASAPVRLLDPDPSPYAAVTFGAIAAVTATLAGLLGGLVSTEGRTGLPVLILVTVAAVFSLVGTFVAALCRILERRLRGVEAPARLDSLFYVPLGLAVVAGAWAVRAFVLYQDSFGGDPFF